MPQAKKRPVVIGLDSGSTGVKIVTVDTGTGGIIEVLPYRRHHNNYEQTARALLRELLGRYDVQAVNVTGSTGKVLHLAWPSTSFVAEVEAQAAGARSLNPEVEAVIDGGGSEIKFFKVDREGRICDFAMNPECAAGSGNFLDVQAKRLILEIDDDSNPARHFPTLGLEAIRSGKTVPISGRCSVFAKSDMIHQQQKLVSVAAIVGGLHESMANNIKATIIQQRLRGFRGILAFQGGLSQNTSLCHCLATQLGLAPNQLFRHQFGYAAGAIGAALAGTRTPFDPTDLDRETRNGTTHHVWEKLTEDFRAEKGEVSSVTCDLVPGGPRLRAYLGIDIGSVSTNVVLLEEGSEQVLAKYYGPTMGRPIEAVKKGLVDMVEDLASQLGIRGPLEEKVAAVERRIEIAGVATTGSGRFMTGHFLPADCIRNEITAQATGAVRLAKPLGVHIDTIFEIGGQDSKYIKLNPDGGVRDYTMNKVCAAGCGSFLEEQAEKLALNVKEEFARIALSAERPANLGDRCTVFIESVLDSLSGSGEPRENLVAGLAYSVAHNYLNRVVEGRDIEGNIFFQGGTAFNRAVVLAFQKVLNKPVWVTPHNEVTGAVGAACLAKDYVKEQLAENPGYRTPFCGMLEAINKPYESEERSCRQCPNRCELQVVKVRETVAGPDGQPATCQRMIFYGDRCDEMNLNQGRGRTKQADSYHDQRNRILFDQPLKPQNPNGKRIGIPRAMSMWGEHFPLWTTLFTELGFEVVLSGATTKTTIGRGAATSLSDYCVPIRTAHGAVQELLEQEPKPDYIFIPHLITYEKRNPRTTPYACLWTQCLPIAIGEAFDFEARGVKLLRPVCEFQRQGHQMFELEEYLTEELGISKRRVQKGLEKGFEAMRKTRKHIVELGKTVLKELGPEHPAFLVIGRAYNSCDPGLSLDIALKLQRLGHPAIPMEFLPLEEIPLVEDLSNMYWKSGERILSAFRYAAEHEGLIPIWITNFGCGPDSFIRKQVRHVMGERPYLEIELDEHTADAGIITRIEAFYDSYRSTLESVRKRAREKQQKKPAHKFEISGKEVGRGRVLTFCYMDDATFALAAIFRSRGLEAVVLPRTSPESLALGKRYSSGQECVPYQTTLGDKLLFLTSDKKRYQVLPDEVRTFDREIRAEDVIFYDPFASGPCRFGQYNEGYKRIYEELGIPVRMLCSGDFNNYVDIFKDAWDAFRTVLLAYDGICATDTLQKAKRIVRPVAENPEEVTALYHKAVAEVVMVLEKSGDSFFAVRAKQEGIEDILRRYAKAFAAVPRNPEKEADIANVGMFGEIYVRSERFINESLIDRLEQCGIRTYLAPTNEWIQYANYEYLWDRKTWERCRNPWQVLRRLSYRRHQIDARLKRWWMPHRLRKLQEPFRSLEGWLEDPHIEDTIAAATNKVPFHIKGELILSWGLIREIQHNPNLHGIVNIGPFGCMPSKVVSTLLHNPEITKPVYDANYDGSVTNTRSLKIETFASQVKAYARKARMPLGEKRSLGDWDAGFEPE
ncbi:putative CoA-substrate-specific enzyme activase [Geothermobacter ehrlichii]|uniref:Putative CoA-substrate-specific enzyme activase n=1 Tax=Geothermobacter ehrlichii TaxID=213224 RepID=A0A5D3WLU7_9BACT|nr:acyl-CoA dehydratase activase [Geothermobacter ehrlichii]TYO99163.1 putative CoA-substrate-specific enzyme activase [Geothermobacter ehrlichii]